MRGATDKVIIVPDYDYHFYSHAPCGARHPIYPMHLVLFEFLLTRPMRGATTICSK